MSHAYSLSEEAAKCKGAAFCAWHMQMSRCVQRMQRTNLPLPCTCALFVSKSWVSVVPMVLRLLTSMVGYDVVSGVDVSGADVSSRFNSLF
jgi:hypothetical protein